MKRYELWIDNDGRLTVSTFKSIESLNEIGVYKGRETYNLLKKLSNKPLVDIYENPNHEEITLECKDYIININDMEKVFAKRGMGPIINNIRLFKEKKTLKRTKKKKVTRKNKYSGRKIVAAGLTLIVLSSSLYGFKDKVNAITTEDLNLVEDTSITTIEENPQIVNLSISNNSENISINEELFIDYDSIEKVSIDYGDRSDTTKAYTTKAYYGDIIEKYASKYGMDTNLVVGIATQERGIHGTTIDEGGAIGLMQVQYSVWANQKISAYNFDTGEKESFTIDPSRLSDIDYNIKIGCMILQNTMEYMNYNTVAAVQCYNMGYGSMKKILKAYSNDCGKSVEQILNDTTDSGWLEYRDLIKSGDQQYVEHVFSWMGENIDVKTIKKDGSIVNLNINNHVSSKKIY